MTTIVNLSDYENLEKIINIIEDKNVIHANNLKKFLINSEREFLLLSESYLQKYSNFLTQFNYDFHDMVNAYLLMVKDILIEQVRFNRNQKYRFDNIKDADKNVYSNQSYMFKYMIGVALSQFLWDNHKKMFLLFQDTIKEQSGERYLEIGCGHGLYLMEALKDKKFRAYDVVDISETSIDFAKKMSKYFNIDEKETNLNFMLSDITQHTFENQYNFITMGEVLEHVEKPIELVKAVYQALKPRGMAYLSTCSNCPVIDHIYLYNNVHDIVEQIESVGFTIEKELIVCNDCGDEPFDKESSKNISYACIVKK